MISTSDGRKLSEIETEISSSFTFLLDELCIKTENKAVGNTADQLLIIVPQQRLANEFF